MIPDFYTKIDEVFSDWNYRHPRILYALIRWFQPKVVVEVGTFRGYSACWMGRALQENEKADQPESGHLYCIDAWCVPTNPAVDADGGFEPHWRKNLATMGVTDKVTLIKGKSHQVEWPDQIDMAFIDADHSYAACTHDVNQALMKGAHIIAADNVHLTEGSRRWADEFREICPEIGWDIFEVPFQEGFLIAAKKPVKGDCKYTEETPEYGDLSDPTTEYGRLLMDMKPSGVDLVVKPRAIDAVDILRSRE